jgi:hypothetical protein
MPRMHQRGHGFCGLLAHVRTVAKHLALTEFLWVAGLANDRRSTSLPMIFDAPSDGNECVVSCKEEDLQRPGQVRLGAERLSLDRFADAACAQAAYAKLGFVREGSRAEPTACQTERVRTSSSWPCSGASGKVLRRHLRATRRVPQQPQSSTSVCGKGVWVGMHGILLFQRSEPIRQDDGNRGACAGSTRRFAPN